MARTLADMTPEDARDDLIHLDDFEVGDVYKTCRQALETIANMTVEVEYRIVPADSNGGIYQTRRWTRHVTEWMPDVAS